MSSPQASASPLSGQPVPAWRQPAFIVSVVILVVATLAMGGVVRLLKANLVKRPIEVERKCQALPSETENWIQVGEDRKEEEVVEGVLGTKNYLSRVYVRKDTQKTEKPVSVELHLAYYTGMVDTVPHVPERCLVGGGASIVGGTVMAPVPINPDKLIAVSDAETAGAPVPLFTARVNTPKSPMNGQRVRLPRGWQDIKLRVTEFAFPGTDTRMFAGYFFIANGGIATSAEDVRLLAFDLRSDYAYYMKVQLSAFGLESPQKLGETAGQLLDELLPEIMLCVPDWAEVEAGRFPPDNPRRIEP